MVDIRRANLGDLDVLVHLRLELLREIGNLVGERDTAALTGGIRQYLAENMPKGQFAAWVAEADGRVVGTSGLTFIQRPPTAENLSGHEAYIMNMYTLPACRGEGIGTALLREVMGFVKSTGVRTVWLRATEDGKPVYEKAGFVSEASYMELFL